MGWPSWHWYWFNCYEIHGKLYLPRRVLASQEWSFCWVYMWLFAFPLMDRKRFLKHCKGQKTIWLFPWCDWPLWLCGRRGDWRSVAVYVAYTWLDRSGGIMGAASGTECLELLSKCLRHTVWKGDRTCIRQLNLSILFPLWLGLKPPSNQFQLCIDWHTLTGLLPWMQFCILPFWVRFPGTCQLYTTFATNASLLTGA